MAIDWSIFKIHEYFGAWSANFPIVGETKILDCVFETTKFLPEKSEKRVFLRFFGFESPISQENQTKSLPNFVRKKFQQSFPKFCYESWL